MNAYFLIPVFIRLGGEIPNIKIVQIVRTVNFIFFDSKIKNEKVQKFTEVEKYYFLHQMRKRNDHVHLILKTMVQS